MKMAKNQAKAMQYLEAELLQFENYTLSSSMLLPKTNMRYSEEYAKKRKKKQQKQGCLFWWDYMINCDENEGENEK